MLITNLYRFNFLSSQLEEYNSASKSSCEALSLLLKTLHIKFNVSAVLLSGNNLSCVSSSSEREIMRMSILEQYLMKNIISLKL